MALSKEQINNLKSDILWYVEEVVNGEKVLVPKLYLTKNTLNSITEEQGNIIKAGGSFVVNNASIVDNSGKIIAKNNVLVKSKNIYQNAAYSDTGIYANDVALIAKENIENIGGNIVADDNVLMYSENGDIKNSKKLSIHENDYNDVFTDVRGSGNIVGNNISIVANEEVYSKDYNEAGNTTPDSEIPVSSYGKLEKGYSNGKYVDKKKLTNGKIRYYEKAKPANNPAEHRKETRLVIKYNPETGQKRAWLETIDSDKKVRMVRPEKNNNTKTHYEFDKNGKYIGTKEEREMRNSKKE